MAAVPFFLVTGFLGSGKTTFLKQLIEHNDDRYKVGIIQNEFAPANIDGIELRDLKKPFEILEINNGSVFCVCLLGDFISSLKSFLDQEKPDLVILESSGLSDPISISEILQSDQLKELVYLLSSWCIIDVVNYHKMFPILTRIKHQISIADYLVLNKIDLADSKQLESVKISVQQINSVVQIMETEYCKIDADLFFRNIGIGRNLKPKESYIFDNPGRPAMIARVFKTSRKININNLRKLISIYIEHTIRIKGFVLLNNNNVVSVQTVFDKIEIKQVDDKTRNTALILMGEDFNLSEFNRDFRQLME